ncbi:hypothetical protein [Bacillus cereus group sp. TH152-1LC]|uniref:hypothetical protein n=1 Tax=Bacillus cereus group sp. TH152-1LC TaxID=3018060 RepID=UPI0022E64BE6|nr:hypothetical protein [Bacillus cereus group sp. TH152-1LC]MDA1674539.1 hypothetical protein [Bacillus cereus group sp. TH152-1LC]
MKNHIEKLSDKLSDYYNDEEWDALVELLDSLEFKYNKTSYHLVNIKQKLEKSTDFNMDNYYDEVCNPLYYETESFVIAMRSTADIIMHIINRTMKLGIESSKVNLSTVYKHPKTTKTIKNILHRYTHNRDSALWNFFYQFRNEIVHEKSITQTLPITINFFNGPQPLAYFEINGQKQNVVIYLETALNFLKRFVIHLFEQIEITVERNFS